MTVPSRFIPRDAALSDPVCYDMSGTALKSSETCNVAVTDDIRSTELQNIVLRGFHYRSSIALSRTGPQVQPLFKTFIGDLFILHRYHDHSATSSVRSSSDCLHDAVF
jgi:hypothetical protein